MGNKKMLVIVMALSLILLGGCTNEDISTSLLNEEEVVTDNDVDEIANQSMGILTINSTEVVDGSLIGDGNYGVEENQNLVKVNVTITNPNAVALSYNSVNMVAYDTNDNKVLTNTLYYDESEEPLLFGELETGESETGYIYFSVEKAQSIKEVALLNDQFELIDAVSVDM